MDGVEERTALESARPLNDRADHEAHNDARSPREPADATSWEAARQGDPEAFRRLHERYAPLVHAVLLARVPAADAEDLVQEVFWTAHRKIATLRDDEAGASWLTTIARNRAIDFLRREGRRRTAELSDELASKEMDPQLKLEAAEALDAIRSLPEAYRETLLLRLVEGLTGPEIAELSGLTPGSVRVNLHRGMKLLRAKLEGNDDA